MESICPGCGCVDTLEALYKAASGPDDGSGIRLESGTATPGLPDIPAPVTCASCGIAYVPNVERFAQAYIAKIERNLPPRLFGVETQQAVLDLAKALGLRVVAPESLAARAAEPCGHTIHTHYTGSATSCPACASVIPATKAEPLAAKGKKPNSESDFALLEAFVTHAFVTDPKATEALRRLRLSYSTVQAERDHWRDRAKKMAEEALAAQKKVPS